MSTSNKPSALQPITTVILAGGLGTRIGGSKGLQTLHGRPLIGWILDIIDRQSDEVLLNVNGEPDAYLRFGHRIISDQTPGWAGPLAGLQSALRCAQHDWVACVPCDTPFLPGDLLTRLLAAVDTIGADAAVAVAEGKRQPTIALYHKRVLPSLDAYLSSGKRKVTDWQNTLRLSDAVFDNAHAFTNINSQDDLSQFNQVAANSLGKMTHTSGAPIASEKS